MVGAFRSVGIIILNFLQDVGGISILVGRVVFKFGELPRTARQTFILDVSCAVDSVSIAPDGLALLRDLGTTPPPLAVSGPTPNPASGTGAGFLLFLTNDAKVIVNIYDIKGSLVYSENLGPLSANAPQTSPPASGHQWRWAPTARGRQSVASGTYFVEFQGNGGRQVRPLTLIK